jgi:uncharacterized membrane protein YeiH
LGFEVCGLTLSSGKVQGVKLPLIFRKEIYALACIVGGTAYYFIRKTNMDEDISKIICILLIFAIRIVAFRFKLSLPRISLK